MHDEPGEQSHDQNASKVVRWVCLLIPGVLVRVQLVTRPFWSCLLLLYSVPSSAKFGFTSFSLPYSGWAAVNSCSRKQRPKKDLPDDCSFFLFVVTVNNRFAYSKLYNKFGH